MNLKLTIEEIDAARSPKGGWTAKTLAGWGVSWPPPSGWKQRLLIGNPVPMTGQEARAAASTPSDAGFVDHKRMLHQVVMALINAGQGDLLNELPEVAAYYNCRIPTVGDIVGEVPETAIFTGGITLEDRVYRFSCARVVAQDQASKKSRRHFARRKSRLGIR